MINNTTYEYLQHIASDLLQKAADADREGREEDCDTYLADLDAIRENFDGRTFTQPPENEKPAQFSPAEVEEILQARKARTVYRILGLDELIEPSDELEHETIGCWFSARGGSCVRERAGSWVFGRVRRKVA